MGGSWSNTEKTNIGNIKYYLYWNQQLNRSDECNLEQFITYSKQKFW